MSTIKTKDIIYETVNKQFAKIRQLDVNLVIDTSEAHVFVNATKACDEYSNKKKLFRKWKILKDSKEKIFYIQERLGMKCVMYNLKSNGVRTDYPVLKIGNKYEYPTENEIKTKYTRKVDKQYINNDTCGTYVHEKLIPAIMCWSSNRYYDKVSDLVIKISNKREMRRLDEKWEREMAKQAKLHKNTVRKKNRRIKKKKCVIEKLREEMKKYQEQTMRGIGVLKEKHDEAKQQRDEATELLVEAKEERDEAKEDFDILNNKVDKIVNHIVPPAIRHSKSENCIVFKIPRTTKSKKISDFRRRKDNQLPQYMDYYVSCCQSYSVDGVKERIMKKHGAKPIIIKKMKPSPNSKNIFHRFQEKYGATLAKSKKAKKPVVYNYNYVGLYGTTTEADIIRFLDEVEAEKEFRHEEV